MRFWKLFAWMALAWTVIARRGAGVLIRKRPSEKGSRSETEPRSQSGPGWRRVSSGSPYPSKRSESTRRKEESQET